MLVEQVLIKAEDTKEYIEIQETLKVPGSKMNDGQLDLWEMTLESLLDTVNSTVKEHKKIKAEFRHIADYISIIIEDSRGYKEAFHDGLAGEFETLQAAMDNAVDKKAKKRATRRYNTFKKKVDKMTEDFEALGK